MQFNIAGSVERKVTYSSNEIETNWDHVLFTSLISEKDHATGGQHIFFEPDYSESRIPGHYGRILAAPLKEVRPLVCDGLRCGFSFVNLSFLENQDDFQKEISAGQGGLAIILALDLDRVADVAGRRDTPFKHALLASRKRFDRQTLHLTALLLYEHLASVGAVKSITRRSEASPCHRLENLLDALWIEKDPNKRKTIILRYANSLQCLGELLPSDSAPRMPAYLVKQVPASPVQRLYISYNVEQSFGALVGYAAQIAAILYSSNLNWTVTELNCNPKKCSSSDFRDRGLSVLLIPHDQTSPNCDDGKLLSLEELPRPEAQGSRARTAAMIFARLGILYETKDFIAPKVAQSVNDTSIPSVRRMQTDPIDHNEHLVSDSPAHPRATVDFGESLRCPDGSGLHKTLTFTASDGIPATETDSFLQQSEEKNQLAVQHIHQQLQFNPQASISIDETRDPSLLSMKQQQTASNLSAPSRPWYMREGIIGYQIVNLCLTILILFIIILGKSCSFSPSEKRTSSNGTKLDQSLLDRSLYKHLTCLSFRQSIDAPANIAISCVARSERPHHFSRTNMSAFEPLGLMIELMSQGWIIWL